MEHVCEQFLSSRQYWEYLTRKGLLPAPDSWIHQTNHIALGVGQDQVEFIKKRYEAMKDNPVVLRSGKVEGACAVRVNCHWLSTRRYPPCRPLHSARLLTARCPRMNRTDHAWRYC